MQESQFLSTQYSKTIDQGKITWESPSNIALVKYWGKKEDQIPENPSISFTLDSCKTTTTLSFTKKDKKDNFFLLICFLKENKRKILNQKFKHFLNELKLIYLF